MSPHVYGPAAEKILQLSSSFQAPECSLTPLNRAGVFQCKQACQRGRESSPSLSCHFAAMEKGHLLLALETSSDH